MAVIDGVDRMEVAVSVSEALVPKLARGDEVDVSISSLGVQVVGTIKSIDLAASMQTKLYNVTVSINEDVAGLLSGMFADVSFRTDTSTDTLSRTRIRPRPRTSAGSTSPAGTTGRRALLPP